MMNGRTQRTYGEVALCLLFNNRIELTVDQRTAESLGTTSTLAVEFSCDRLTWRISSSRRSSAEAFEQRTGRERRCHARIFWVAVSVASTCVAPALPVRGHQLGYRLKSNTYDGWNGAQFEQYVRDLAVFGTNTIELLSPVTDDALSSPLFSQPALETMSEEALTPHRWRSAQTGLDPPSRRRGQRTRRTGCGGVADP